MSMIKKIRLPLALAAAGVMGSVGAAHAVDFNVQAEATIEQAFTLDTNTGMNFGTVGFILDGTNDATLTLDTASTATPATNGGSSSSALGGTPAAGNYTITTNPGANVQITFPSGQALSPAGAGDDLTVNDFVIDATLSSGSFAGSTATAVLCNDAIDATAGGACQFTADGTSGTLTFSLGASLVATAAGSYPTDTYTGDILLQVVGF